MTFLRISFLIEHHIGNFSTWVKLYMYLQIFLKDGFPYQLFIKERPVIYQVTMNDNEIQHITTNDKVWQEMIANGNK